jgi:hypothetical protein
MIRLTVNILRQLGVGVPKLRLLLSYHLELVRNLGELTVCRRQVCHGHAQVTLQLGHPSIKRRLLTSGGLGGVPGSGLGCGHNSLRPLGGLLNGRSNCPELLDLKIEGLPPIK